MHRNIRTYQGHTGDTYGTSSQSAVRYVRMHRPAAAKTLSYCTTVSVVSVGGSSTAARTS